MAAQRIKGKTIFKRETIRIVEALRVSPKGKVKKKALIDLSDVSVVIPVKSDGKLIMENHYRYAADKWLMELPAGKVDDNEDPKVCAKRELEEETGYRSEKIRYLATFYVMPGRSNYRIHLYLATKLRKTSTQKLDEDEFLQVKEIGFPKLMKMLKAGKIEDQKSATALLYYAAFSKIKKV